MNIGHNLPPSMTETALEVANDLNEWLKERPLIETEDAARDAKPLIDRARLCLKDLDDERAGKVRPLNDQVKAINDSYRQPRGLLQRILDEIETRVSHYLRAEEARRRIAAETARQAAEKAERIAREAERIEQERLDNARAGELGIDLVGASQEADDKFAEYEKAQRQAALAEKETTVKIGGGFSRAISLKCKETLTITNAKAAIDDIGMTEGIEKAILMAARAFRKINGRLPVGIKSETEREI